MPESVPGDATPTADNGLADEAAMVRENMAVEDVVQRSGAGTVAERRTAIRAYYAAQDKAEIERLTADRDRLRAEVERLQAGQGKPQRGRPIPPCHPRGDGCDVGSHYLTVRHPDGSMGWTVHISDREIQHLRWLTGPEELRAYSDVAQRSLGSAPGEWTVSPPQDASVSAPQIIRAVPVSDQPDREELARQPDLIDGQGNRWVWNPDGYRTRPSSTRIWMRAEIERRWPPVVEAGPAAEQPVQPAPDVIARFLETGTAEQNIHLHEQNVELRRLLAAAQGAASAPVESAGTGEPETFSQEIARKHEENLREQARSDYEAIQEAKRRAPAPERVVSDPGRERERLWIDPSSDRPQDERRAGLSWDQVCDAVGDHVFAYPDPDHSTDWCVNATGAVDAIWALLARPLPDVSTDQTEWAVIAYDVEKEADRVDTCEDEADARELLAYQQRSMRLRDARIVTRNATPWLPYQAETEEQP